MKKYFPAILMLFALLTLIYTAQRFVKSVQKQAFVEGIIYGSGLCGDMILGTPKEIIMERLDSTLGEY